MNKLKISILLALIPFLGSAQENLSLNLAEAQAYAVENSFSVKNARIDALSAESEVKALTSIGLPQVSGSIDYQNFIDIPTQVAPADAFGFPAYLNDFLFGVAQETGVPINAPDSDPNAISELQFGAPQTMTAGISVSQLIFDGSYFVGLQAAKAYKQVMEGSIKKTEQQVKDRVAQAYHTVLVAKKNVEVLSKSILVMEKTLAETKALKERGFIEQQDVDQIQLTLNDMNNKHDYAGQQEELAMLMLKFQLGVKGTDQVTLTDTIDNLTSTDHVDLCAQPFNLSSNIDYQVQSDYRSLMELTMKNEKAKGLPSIGGFYNYQQNAQRDDFSFLDFDKTWYPVQIWGVSLNVPIWTSFQGKHRVQKAKLEVERADLTLLQIEDGAIMEYKSALSEYGYSKKNLANQEESHGLAQRIFDQTSIKYKEGVASSMELAQTESQLLTAHGSVINATLALLNATSRLNKALGRY